MGGERILVVDDEASVRGAVAQVLREDGHQISAVASGEEALAVFRKEPYPLVVSDIRLGSMDGLELLNEIKRIHSDPEVVIMTGHASMENAITAMRAGAYDYLVKPLEDLHLISNAASRALKKIRLRAENRRLMETLKKQNDDLEHRALGPPQPFLLADLHGRGFLQAVQRHPRPYGRRPPAAYPGQGPHGAPAQLCDGGALWR